MKKLIVIAIIAICVGLMAAFPHIMLNPGEIVAGHQKLNNDCNACHDPFFGISSEKCISCHKLDEIGLDSLGNKKSVLFHRKFNNKECTTCHTDHKGVNPSVLISRFDHSFLSSAEQAKCNSCHDKPSDSLHKQLSVSCGSCHNANDWSSVEVFNHNLIQGSAKNNCLSCHKNPSDSFHSSFKTNCSECHSFDKWVPSTFDHSSYFLLDRDHNAECKTCHSDNNFSIYSCYGCHEHSESKIREEHIEEGISNFEDCVSCHRSADEHDIRYEGRSKNHINQKEVNKVNKYINSQKKNENQNGKEEDDD